MGNLVGQIRSGRLWIRCWICGDSSDLNHAHLSISQEGLYHCVRCGSGGRLSPKRYLELVSNVDFELIQSSNWAEAWEEIYEQIIPGPGSSRFSALDRFHYPSGKEIEDVFLSKDSFNDTVGLALVSISKGKRLVGVKGIGYSGDRYLVSSIDSPLVLVEGPYDVLDDRDICGFGLPDHSNMRWLKGQFVVLCPDGDVWVDDKKLQVIRNTLQKYQEQILGVYILPNGKDPDEVPKAQRKYIAKEKLINVHKDSSRSISND